MRVASYLPYMWNGFALLEILVLVVVVLQKGHYKALYRLGKLEEREVAGKQTCKCIYLNHRK